MGYKMSTPAPPPPHNPQAKGVEIVSQNQDAPVFFVVAGFSADCSHKDAIGLPTHARGTGRASEKALDYGRGENKTGKAPDSSGGGGNTVLH